MSTLANTLTTAVALNGCSGPADDDLLYEQLELMAADAFEALGPSDPCDIPF